MNYNIESKRYVQHI